MWDIVLCCGENSTSERRKILLAVNSDAPPTNLNKKQDERRCFLLKFVVDVSWEAITESMESLHFP